jgi:hypothetical protein
MYRATPFEEAIVLASKRTPPIAQPIVCIFHTDIKTEPLIKKIKKKAGDRHLKSLPCLFLTENL